MAESNKVEIIEVGPRDGLQNEKEILSGETKIEFITGLSKTGLRRIEIGSFVSPKWVPQMEGSAEIVNSILEKQSSGELPKDISYSVLVPNGKGMANAAKTAIEEVAFFTAASEAFTLKNINCTIEESFSRMVDIMAIGEGRAYKYRGYISTAFYCPYAGRVEPKKVLPVAEKLIELGCYEISIGDTIGAATPREVRTLLSELIKDAPPEKLAMHFHDTRGTAIANIAESLKFDIRKFDSSLGGLGGCPYAPGAAGNVATEDVVYFLNGEGFEVDARLDDLIKVNQWMARTLGRELPSKVAQAGLPLGHEI